MIDEMRWYKVSGEFQPQVEVLAKDAKNNLLVGWMSFKDAVCESDETMLRDVTHFLPTSELIINIRDQK